MELKFQEIKQTTKTIMAYLNFTYDLKKLYDKLPYITIDIPLTKRKKNPNFKKVKAPNNNIYILQYGKECKGIVREIKTFFPNQVSCRIFIEDINIHMMIFKDKVKMVSCKNIDHAIKTMKIIWKISKRLGCHTMHDGETIPKIIFVPAMNNLDFNLGFNIDRIKLDSLINSKYKNRGIISDYQPDHSTSVNIKFKCDNFTPSYKCLVLDKKYFITTINTNKFKKIKKKEDCTTFLVFRSSRIKESGKYPDIMENNFNQFMKIIRSHRKDIEEKLDNNDSTFEFSD